MGPKETIDDLFNPGRCPGGYRQRSSIIPKRRCKQSVDDQGSTFEAQISMAPCINNVVEFFDFRFPV